jgi:riboflavin kinase/FMN adenylyltransferase|tara:strand:+ start:311 stop:1204 length:894 start_codon:yes stop_codon:yes gene_type:complete
MKIYDNFGKDDSITSDVEVTCIGAFDGVHKGHIELINKTKEINKNFQIVTFDEIPKLYFDKSLKPLLDNKNKNNIFNDLKPTNLIYLKFDEINQLSSDEFLKYLDINLRTKKIVVGKDFKFGKNRSGDVDNIISYFGKDNVILLSDYIIDNEKVSSTKIRNFLDTGNIQKANNFLGREYELSGLVVKGKKLGSKIGFPTANLQLNNDLYLPKFGVYEISCKVNGNLFKGILNIGITPTVLNSKKVKIEAHLFNFNENIYDKNIVIQLKKFIREEIKFNSIDDLIKQINIDISSVKKK